ncbi:MAG TPA: hypothetical protein VE569_06140 [Acidimicrobiia bacterium]|jgi:hypothetical protein|nr:hypothetical protein [Acidimicrobiia bacterium]
MTANNLIDDYATALSGRLPQPVVEELLDGLAETYHDQLTKTADESAAAQAAITEFGHPDVCIEAFIHYSPGRRLAMTLLATGPLMGLAWATVLIASKAWNWPIPFSARIAFGLALFVAIATLVETTRNRQQLRRSRTTARIGALTLIVLDGTLIAAALILAQLPVLVLLPAAAASIIRILFTAQRLSRLLSV